MLETEIRDRYRTFFKEGGYRLTRLAMTKVEGQCERSENGYNILSIMGWDETCDSFDSMMRNLQSQEIEKIIDIYDFSCALEEILEKLPRGWGEIVENTYGKNSNDRGDGLAYRKRTVENALEGAVKKIAECKGPYDFKKEGLPVVEKVLKVVEKAKGFEQVNGKIPILKAMDIMKFYRNSDEGLTYTNAVMEFCENSGISQKLPDCGTVTTPKKRRTEKGIKIYTDEDADCNMYIYKLYANGHFITSHENPSFLLSKNDFTLADKFEIRKDVRDTVGQVFIPTEKEEKDTTVFYTDIYGQGCRYQLLVNGKIIDMSKTPEFYVKDRIPGAQYRIKAVAGNDEIEEKLFIRRELSILDQRSRLEKRTSKQESHTLTRKAYQILKIMKALQDYCPEKYNKLMSFTWVKSNEKLVSLFWELAALIILDEGWHAGKTVCAA